MHPLFKKNCDFKIGATKQKHLPHYTFPEVAFVGRSNVGKSSLLNALVGQNKLARTSKTPGCTRQINIFVLGDNLLSIVDLPGYGYARLSKSEIQKWGQLMHGYLVNRANLQRVYVLVDSRHGLKDTDVTMMNLLDTEGISYQIIMTKADKTSNADMEKHTNAILALAHEHPAMHPEILPISSHKGTGLDRLREELAFFTK